MEIAFNINDPIRFRLTKIGRDILAKSDSYNKEPNWDGYYEMQMWEAMNLFGSSMLLGDRNVFVDNKIWL